MSLKGVVFDFNGTLVWDTAYHNRAFDVFFEKHNIRLTDEEKSVKIHGKTNADIMRGVFERDLTDDETARFAIEKELIYQELIVKDLKFADGVVNLFEILKKKNIPFTIATSADIINVDFYFRELQLHKWFDRNLVVYNDGTVRGKPYPDIFLRAAERLHIQPAEMVVFEDSKAGIKAAENAGTGKVVIVDSAGDDYSEFPHQIIRHFNEFDPEILGL